VKLVHEMIIYDLCNEVIFGKLDFEAFDARSVWDGFYQDQPLNAGTYLFKIKSNLNTASFSIIN